MAVTWTAASSAPLGSAQVSALAVAPGDSQSVIVGTTDGFIYRNDAALDAGSNTAWQFSRPRLGFVSSLAFDPSTTGLVYATFAEFGGPHVWRSYDGAVTWESIDGTGTTAIPDIPVHSIVVDPENPGRLFVGTDLGVMTTNNGGRSWAVENTGFANAVTEWLALGSDDEDNPLLFAFTHGRGAWRVPLNPIPSEPRRPSGRREP
jgi:ligand-binding sensor domain-containing protein